MSTQAAIDLLGVQGWDLFVHMLALSLMAVGGAIVVAPDMHRYLVDDHQWLSHSEFNTAIALAQTAPGPNLTFIPVLGWMVGIHSAQSLGWTQAHWVMGVFGALLCLLAILLPSSVLTYAATRWTHSHRDKRAVIAFRQGLLPVVIALMLSTAWLMSAHLSWSNGWRPWLLSIVVALVIWRTRVHLLVLLGAGALLGTLGWV
jgi:chromate transporter